MKLFECQHCGQVLNFPDTRCERCGRSLGYLSDIGTLSALEPAGDGRWRPLAMLDVAYKFCANDAHAVCNWMVVADGPDIYCRACQLNRTIPDLDDPVSAIRWRRLELAKHRLVYGLIRLGLPLASRFDEPGRGLTFDFLADHSELGDGPPVTTGHARGLITMNIDEADDVERERYRANLAEPYRTVLGHFRHEVGHYYWERLIQDEGREDLFREVFGDERADYNQAMFTNYTEGPPVDWIERYVSPYASSHPWEDWAETWAHYLHMLDTLETAYYFGISIAPRVGQNKNPELGMMMNLDPYAPVHFDVLFSRWLPLVYAGNSLNRSMGQPDLYPFILRPAVLEKLRFIHTMVRGGVYVSST